MRYCGERVPRTAELNRGPGGIDPELHGSGGLFYKRGEKKNRKDPRCLRMQMLLENEVGSTAFVNQILTVEQQKNKRGLSTASPFRLFFRFLIPRTGSFIHQGEGTYELISFNLKWLFLFVLSVRCSHDGAPRTRINGASFKILSDYLFFYRGRCCTILDYLIWMKMWICSDKKM